MCLEWVLCVFSHHCFSFVGRVFDGGKEIELLERFPYFDGLYELSFKKITSGSLVCIVYTILTAECYGRSVCKIVLNQGYTLNLLLMHSIALVLVQAGNIGKGITHWPAVTEVFWVMLLRIAGGCLDETSAYTLSSHNC